MVVDVCFFPSPLSSGLCFVGNKIIHLHITLLYLFFLEVFFILFGIDFLFVGILVVDSIIKVLVV